MSEFDSKALESAREVMELIRQPHIGGDAQLQAKIQLLFVDAMEYAAPQSFVNSAVPDENGNLPRPFCGGKCDAEGWMGSYDEGVPLCGPECEDCGATASSLKEWNRHTVMPAAAPKQESE